MKPGRAPLAQARETVRCVGFSRDGQWLWCGTDVGLRVYEFQRTRGPAPKWSFRTPGAPTFERGNLISSIAEETDAPAIVFGGGNGRLYRLDLNTGESRELITVGQNVAISSLAMSADGKTLGATLGQGAGMPRDVRYTWSIWSYPKLRRPFLRGGE